ncbi:hypothetical protein BU204_37390 [Actinophytocola xanthii]|uniref:Uncharacterized protein n=2 Tax=Actinophytocola xanthii TaxID=1912961 RepID=A0A1Q8BSI3_9PSEU|nr:hypothetical protein BU204_37390 [Actinophytocola xanthii]
MRLLPIVVLVLALSAACSSPRDCTGIGSMPGFGVDVDPALAPRISGGTLAVCWAETCGTHQVDLYPATAAETSTCTGELCSARMRRTGALHGFVTVPDLPEAEVRATLRLTDRSGKAVVDQALDVTPTMTEPNGPGCGGGSPQSQLRVTPTGTIKTN